MPAVDCRRPCPFRPRGLVLCGLVSLVGLGFVAGCSNPLQSGKQGVGGATGSGGAVGTGGVVGSGGVFPIGVGGLMGIGGAAGAVGTGGRMSSGGATSAGGLNGRGGITSTGGVVGTGGASVCTICNGICVDIETDIGNCGECGRACSAVAPSTVQCTAGRCLVTLCSGREHVWSGIAVDGASVRWTEHDGAWPRWPGSGDGRVMKVPVGGGTATMLASKQDFPSYIRVDRTSVYWTTGSTGSDGELAMFGNASVMRASPDGSKTDTVVSRDFDPRGYPFYGDVAVDSTHVYWAYRGREDKDYADGSVLRVYLADGSITILASAQQQPDDIAVDASSVYWVNRGSASQYDKNTPLMKVPIGGGALTVLDVSPSGHAAVALDVSNLYWTNYDGTVMKMPSGGGNPVRLASGPSGQAWIAVDATHVYWANRDEGSIMKIPLAGGTATPLATGQSSIEALAVDGTSIYWTTFGTSGNDYKDGVVMKLTPK
jgi:hypothetical protein